MPRLSPRALRIASPKNVNKASEDFANAQTAQQKAQAAYDEAMNEQTTAADKLGTTNPDVAALQKAYDDASTAANQAGAKLEDAKAALAKQNQKVADAQKAYDDATAKVNDATKSLDDAKTATKKAQDTFNQNNEFATDAAAAYNELKADHAENALNAAQAMLNKVQNVYGYNAPQTDAAEALVNALKDYYLNPTSPADKTATLNKIQAAQDVFNNLVKDANAAMAAAEAKYQDAQKNADAAKAILDRVNNGDFSDFPAVKDAEDAQKLAQTNYDNALANLKNAQANLDIAKANLAAASEKPSTSGDTNKDQNTDNTTTGNGDTIVNNGDTTVNNNSNVISSSTDKKADETANLSRVEYKNANKQNDAKAETLPQTGNENGVAAIALGAAAAMFGLGLAGKKREY